MASVPVFVPVLLLLGLSSMHVSAMSCSVAQDCTDRTSTCLVATCAQTVRTCTYHIAEDGTACSGDGTCKDGGCSMAHHTFTQPQILSTNGDLTLAVSEGQTIALITSKSTGDSGDTAPQRGGVTVNGCAAATACSLSSTEKRLQLAIDNVDAVAKTIQSTLVEEVHARDDQVSTIMAAVDALRSAVSAIAPAISGVATRTQECTANLSSLAASVTSSLTPLQSQIQAIQGDLGGSCVSCRPGFFTAVPCSVESVGECRACPANTFNPAIAAGACKSCTVNCPPGQNMVTACNATANMTCEPCPANSFNTGNSKMCTPCRAPCASNEYLSASCVPSSDGVCLPCGACSAGSFMTSACTSSANVVCRVCSACTGTGIAVGGCTGTKVCSSAGVAGVDGAW